MRIVSRLPPQIPLPFGRPDLAPQQPFALYRSPQPPQRKARPPAHVRFGMCCVRRRWRTATTPPCQPATLSTWSAASSTTASPSSGQTASLCRRETLMARCGSVFPVGGLQLISRACSTALACAAAPTHPRPSAQASVQPLLHCRCYVQATGFVDEATGKNRTVPFELMVQGDKVHTGSCSPGPCIALDAAWLPALLAGTTTNDIQTGRCNTHDPVIPVPET